LDAALSLVTDPSDNPQIVPVAEKRCIVTGDVLTAANDSKAHVIPSALGGRLKPLGILCNDANTLLGDKIDLPFIQAFQAVMTWLNGSRDRGDNQPTRMTDENGRTYLVQFGKPLELTRPEFSKATTPDGTVYKIAARNLKEARTLLGRVKADSPEFDIDEALKHAVLERAWPDGMLHGQLQIGPAVLFPAVFVAASVFATYRGLPPHPELKTYVQAFDPDKPAMPPDTFYFLPSAGWVSAPAEVSHIIALVADPKRLQALVYFEIFNLACVAVVLPYDGTTEVHASYALDVLSGTEVAAQVDYQAVLAASWSATHRLGDPALYRFTQERMHRLMQIARHREWSVQIGEIVGTGLGPADGAPILPAHLAKLVGEIAAFVVLQWKRPGTTTATMEDDLNRFDGLCAALSKHLPFWMRCRYRSLARPHRGMLAKKIRELSASGG
jgi:hypothetical protein